MPAYEHVFLARQDVSSQQVETLTDQYKALIEEGGGRIERIEQWGLKSLAYRIKKNRKAHYTLMNIEAPPAAVAEMERQMNLNEDILRFMTVRLEAFEEGPSVMMQRRDRDDRKRRDRGERGGDRGDRGGDRGERGDRPAPRRD
ncbi:MAG: 30S ribosomal protein S6 [Pseudomonadota bacterium]